MICWNPLANSPVSSLFLSNLSGISSVKSKLLSFADCSTVNLIGLEIVPLIKLTIETLIIIDIAVANTIFF